MMTEFISQSFWQDPLYRQIFIIALSSLFITSVPVYFFRQRNHYLKMAWWSVKSWLLAAPIMLFVLGAPKPWPLVFLTITAIFGTKAFFKIMGIYHKTPFVITSYLGIIALAFATHFERTDLYNLIPMVVLGVLCFIPIFLNSYKSMVQYIALTLMAFIFLGWSFMHLGLILNLENGLYQLLYLILLTEFCDNTNLAMARYFSKPKRLDQVMIRRTYGSTLFSAVLTLALAFAMRHLLPVSSEIFWLTAGLVSSLAGSFGDIILNVVRRDIGIKVVGAFVLGRGDFLSRIDRLIFVAPIYYYLMIYLHKII